MMVGSLSVTSAKPLHLRRRLGGLGGIEEIEWAGWGWSSGWRAMDCIFQPLSGTSWGCSYVHGSGVPIFGTESWKALCDICPVLASDVVPTCDVREPRLRFVEGDHAYVKGILVEVLDDGAF